jgi:hypothetical protein
VFSGIAGIQLLPDGGLLVLDGSSSTIRIFNADGSHRLSIGRSGQGPGEFRWLQHVALIEPDTIVAYDGEQYRVTRFLTDGTLLETTDLRPEQGRPELFVGMYSNGDVAVASLTPAQRDVDRVTADLMKIERFAADGSFVSEITSVEGMRRVGPGPVPFTPFPHAVLVRDSVAYTNGLRAEVLLFGNSASENRAIPVPAAVHDVEAAWGSLRTQMATQDNAERLRDFPDVAQTEGIPAVAEMLADSEERLWLKQFDPTTDSYLLRRSPLFYGGHWTVVTLDGNVVADVTMPDGFAPVAVNETSVAGVHRDAVGVEQVWVLDLRK